MKLNKLLQLIRDNARADASAPSIRVEAEEAEAHVYVYDVIDAWWGCNAAQLVAALTGIGNKPVHLHVNSPGGDVFEARAMAAAIVAHPAKVTAHIDGLAASAATYLALAANEVRITQGGMVMIHNSWTITWGDKAELRDTADLLEKIDVQIAADYTRKTKKSNEQVVEWMNATTWFTAEEALEAGLVDVIDANTKRDDEKASAQASAGRWNLAAYPNAPKLQTSVHSAPDLAARAAALRTRNENRLRLVAEI